MIAVGAECHAPHRVVMAAKGSRFFAGRHVPELHGSIRRGAGQRPAVGTKRYGQNLLVVSDQQAFRPAGGIPKVNFLVVAAGGKKPSVGTERRTTAAARYGECR